MIRNSNKVTAGPLSQLLSASAQDVTYIILTDRVYSCPSLSNILIYYITLHPLAKDIVPMGNKEKRYPTRYTPDHGTL